MVFVSEKGNAVGLRWFAGLMLASVAVETVQRVAQWPARVAADGPLMTTVMFVGLPFLEVALIYLVAIKRSTVATLLLCALVAVGLGLSAIDALNRAAPTLDFVSGQLAVALQLAAIFVLTIAGRRTPMSTG